MNDADVLAQITLSLEQSAATGQDITDPVYEHFFAHCAAAIPLMGHSDQHMRGRMMEQVIELLLDDQLQGEGNYFRWEIENHLSAYNVEADMYEAFLDAVQHAVRESIADQWNPSMAQAWQKRIAALVSEVKIMDAVL